MASIGTVGKVDGNGIDKMLVGASVPARSSEAAESAAASPALTHISSTGRLQQILSQLADTGRRLSRAETWQESKATSSSHEILDVSTQDAPSTQKIDVQVDQVAASQTTVASLFSPLSTPIGLGTLLIQMGSWDASMRSFTVNPNWPKAAITTGPGDTSVEHVRDKINAAGIGIYANVISDVTGTYLILRASSTGRENGFRITADISPQADEAQARFMKSLEFDPAARPEGMNLAQDAQDAAVRVNGQPMTSATNFVKDLVPGLDATLKKASPHPVSIAIEPDRQSVKTLIGNFVDHYNELQSQLESQRASTAPSVVEAASVIQTNVRAIWANPTSSSDIRANLRDSLKTLGVSMAPDQRLMLDTSRLDRRLMDAGAPLAPLEGLAHLLNAGSSNTASAEPEPATWQAPPAPNTSPLFRQVVLEQYAHAVYTEDVH